MADDAYINAGLVSITQSEVVDELRLGTVAGTANLNFPGGQLDSSFGRIGYAAGSNGTVTLSGTGSLWDNQNTLQVGRLGTGTLNISSGADVENHNAALGFDDAGNGTATVAGLGSNWTSAGFLYVGEGAQGTLNIQNAGTVTNHGVGAIGVDLGSVGNVSLTGFGSTWNNTDSLYVGGYDSGAGGTGTLTTDADGTVVVGDVALAGSTAGSLTVSDSVAGGASGGLLMVYAGGTINHTGLAVLGDQAGEFGVADVTGMGATWSNTGELLVGDAGTGTLNIAAGGEVSNTVGRVANEANSSGTVTITGSDSLWENTAFVQVGLGGAGNLTIADSGMLTNPVAAIGVFNTSTGVVNVNSGGQWVNNGFLRVGEFGNGELSIASGGVVDNTLGTIGHNAGSSGTVTVGGSGSTWTNTTDLYVGRDGIGTLTIENFGSVHVGDAALAGATPGWLTVSDSTNTDGTGVGGHLYVLNGSTLEHGNTAVLGHEANEYGYATVNGPNSTWTNASRLYVGGIGNGTLTVEAGGAVSNSEGFISIWPGSSGTATVTGDNSLWDITGRLLVGERGNGTLNVEAGGAVSNTTGYIGFFLSSTGVATVTGTGSTWTNTSDLYVGRDGTGTLTIENDGSVHVGDAAQAGATVGHLTVSDSTNTDGTGVGGHLYVRNGSTLNHGGAALLGDDSGEYGYATVTGDGSEWSNAREMHIGSRGTGTLTILGGGRVHNTNSMQGSFVGTFTGGTGTVRVTGVSAQGTRSEWINTTQSVVGYEGAGDLSIEDGGRVSDENGVLGQEVSGIGTATVTGVASTGERSEWVNSAFTIDWMGRQRRPERRGWRQGVGCGWLARAGCDWRRHRNSVRCRDQWREVGMGQFFQDRHRCQRPGYTEHPGRGIGYERSREGWRIRRLKRHRQRDRSSSRRTALHLGEYIVFEYRGR